MNYSVWIEELQNEVDEITVIEGIEPTEQVGKNAKILRIIEADSWDEAMKQHHELMGWEPYKSE